jgi:hypothetical protein
LRHFSRQQPVLERGSSLQVDDTVLISLFCTRLPKERLLKNPVDVTEGDAIKVWFIESLTLCSCDRHAE